MNGERLYAPRMTSTQRGAISDQRVLQAIKDQMVTAGYPPSIRELSRTVGLSLASTHDALKRLTESGVITVAPFVSRGIVLLDP